MGNATITNSKRAATAGGKYVVECDLTLSASYATGGDTIPMNVLPLRRVDEILIPSHDLVSRKAITVAAAGNRALSLGGTSSAPKVIAKDAAGVEVVAATNVATNVRRVRFVGV